MPAPIHPAFYAVFEEIFDRFPAARDFDPCPCGRVLAIIRPEHVRDWHFPIPDLDLRERVRAIIKSRDLLFSNYDGDDGVLVIAEIA